MKKMLLLLSLTVLIFSCTVPMDQPVTRVSDTYEADALGDTKCCTGSTVLEDMGDHYLMGGDMILYKDDVNHQKIINAVSHAPNCSQGADGDTRAMMTHTTKKWPGGIIPYFFSGGLGEIYTERIREAMDYIESICNVQFIESSPTPRDYKYKIEWKLGTNASSTGYSQTGQMYIFSTDIGVMVHELLHCLGLSHEHQRYDRNSYIRVAPEKENQFGYNIVPQYYLGKLYGKLLSDYDYFSIMHYGSEYITALDPAMQSVIGQRRGLSLTDRAAVISLYGRSTRYRVNYKTGDFDGDGRADILKYDNHLGWVIYRGGSSLSERIYSTNRPTTRWKITNYIGDFNGDGMDDMMLYEYRLGLQVYKATGSSFAVSTWVDLEPGIYKDIVGDFNGDGKDDFARYNKYQGWYVYLSTGSSFVNAGKWSSVLCHSSSDLGWYKGDFNGDGKDDLLLYNNMKGWRVLQSTGSSFTDKIWNTQVTGTKYILGDNVGDFNGDGKDDFIFTCYRKGVRLLSSTGSSFSGSWVICDGVMETRQVGDLNGDGKDDILGFSGDRYVFYLSTGTNFTRGQWKDDFDVATFYIDDFNGDGKDDLMQYVDQPWWRVLRSTGSELVRYSKSSWVAERITSTSTTGSIPGNAVVNIDGNVGFSK